MKLWLKLTTVVFMLTSALFLVFLKVVFAPKIDLRCLAFDGFTSAYIQAKIKTI